ncbi:uncharacterized protein LOC130957039 [Arachis stenosperma]|uniref:uncharacterized protein LOC130957039 n=1 Tax=Arachis stenosperma TaxID=217475 RepID=UPI0025AD7E42|nr:uncharacterized protein LOC130957039 [Arachis stenosperma]
MELGDEAWRRQHLPPFLFSLSNVVDNGALATRRGGSSTFLSFSFFSRLCLARQADIRRDGREIQDCLTRQGRVGQINRWWVFGGADGLSYLPPLAANFMSHFKYVEGKRYLINATYSPNKAGYRYMHALREQRSPLWHNMRKLKGKKKFMTIKIDFEKAYDRLKWSFIEKVLEEFGVPDQLKNIILCCVSSISYKILWNGCKTEAFLPTRGIRQGDPMSPYLFVMAMEKLSHLIEENVVRSDWEPMRVGREGPSISHLLFADDLLLFAEASTQQIDNIGRVLDLFCTVSGLKINQAKTTISFSKNVEQSLKDNITNKCNFKETVELGKYLGAMITNGKTQKRDFRGAVERVKKKLSGWKVGCLSFAGRVTLAQSVLTPSLNYDMMHSFIPKGVCQEIERLQRRFIWAENAGERKFHNVGWHILCKPKILGGLGFKSLSVMNEAFMLKAFWRLVGDNNTLWATVLLNKYDKGRQFPAEMKVKGADSQFWKNLKKVKMIFDKNTSFSIGNGKLTRLWDDPWVENEPLHEHLTSNQIAAEIRNMTVFEAMEQNNDWNYPLLKNHLRDIIINKIRAIHPPLQEAGRDRIRWNATQNGEFSVASAYKLLAGHGKPQDQVWNVIWKWRGPQRMRCFLWMTTHQKLMTANRRSKLLEHPPSATDAKESKRPMSTC